MANFVELDLSIDQCEEGPVASDPDIGAGPELGTALSDEDAAGADDLSTETLDPKSFTRAIAAVLYTATTFFMCHNLK